MKVFSSLPQDQEDEAIACYDRQFDQNVFTSNACEALKESAQKDRERDRLFFFVFGYAQAKGWTDINQRLKLP